MPIASRLAATALVLAALGASGSAQEPPFASLEALGEALFFDKNLSKNRTQACATCHAPEAAFSDPRDNGHGGDVSRAVSLGDDGVSIGGRNAPTATYARFSPQFHQNQQGAYVGGQFWDGRAGDLETQAGGPPLDPAEMGMQDKQAVVDRLQENPGYLSAFELHFGKGVFNDADAAFAGMTKSIAAFERTDVFAPFDSRYDRSLRGEVTLTKQEELGRTLFFSQQFSNCNLCHQLQTLPGAINETFTN